LAHLNATAAAVRVRCPLAVEALHRQAVRFRGRVQIRLPEIRRLAERRLVAPSLRRPKVAQALITVCFRPVNADIDGRAGRIAVLVKPRIREFALENARARIDARVAQVPLVTEYLP